MPRFYPLSTEGFVKIGKPDATNGALFSSADKTSEADVDTFMDNTAKSSDSSMFSITEELNVDICDLPDVIDDDEFYSHYLLQFSQLASQVGRVWPQQLQNESLVLDLHPQVLYLVVVYFYSKKR